MLWVNIVLVLISFIAGGISQKFIFAKSNLGINSIQALAIIWTIIAAAITYWISWNLTINQYNAAVSSYNQLAISAVKHRVDDFSFMFFKTQMVSAIFNGMAFYHGFKSSIQKLDPSQNNHSLTSNPPQNSSSLSLQKNDYQAPNTPPSPQSPVVKGIEHNFILSLIYWICNIVVVGIIIKYSYGTDLALLDFILLSVVFGLMLGFALYIPSFYIFRKVFKS